MAEVSVVLCTSHSPFLFNTTEDWEDMRVARAQKGGYRADLPVDSAEVNEEKFDRCMRALRALRERLDSARPDVLLVFGDDQGEQFDFTNFPAFGIYLGEEFQGYKVSKGGGLPSRNRPAGPLPRTPEHWTTVRGHPELARTLMMGLMVRGFDLAFSLQLAKQEEGIGHAFMRPSYYLRPEYDLPTVPFFVNCYYGPQPTGKRCYALGRAIREVIDAWPTDIRVAVIGSGGLWHTPGAPGAYIDEEFDRTLLRCVSDGNARGMAAEFDARMPTAMDDPEVVRRLSGGTGMVNGIGGGTGEARNWLIAAAVADGVPGTVVDYVPVYASPIGMAFAYWDHP
jgi:hypothetical protein